MTLDAGTGALLGVLATLATVLAVGWKIIVKLVRIASLETDVQNLKKEQERHAQSDGVRFEQIGKDLARLDERSEVHRRRRLSQVGAPVAEIHDGSSEE